MLGHTLHLVELDVQVVRQVSINLKMLNQVAKIVVQASIKIKMLKQVVNLTAQPVLPSMATEPHAQLAH